MRRFVVLILAPALTLLSCPNPFHETDPLVPGTVTVSVATSAARTVVPDYVSAIATIEVSLVSNNGYGTLSESVSASPWQVTFTNVRAGSWNIDVVAKNSGGLQIGSGHTAGQTLASGASLTVPVAVTFSSSASTGDVSFKVTFPASTNVDYVSGTIVETSSVCTPAVLNNAGTSGATLTFSGLPTGTYSLVMTFRRGGAAEKIAGVFREKVIVAAGFTSGLWVASDGSLVPQRAFAATDFYDTNSSLVNLVVSGGVLPSGGFSSGSTSYSQGAFRDLTSVTFTASASVAGQYLRYRWNGGPLTEITPEATSPALTLIDNTAVVGTDNTLQVVVTAPDMQTTTTYTVQFSKAYTVTYSANGATGGTVPTDANLHEAGQPVTVLGNSGNLANSGYTLAGWNTAADGSGTSYSGGDTFAMPAANVTLYAVWNKQINGVTTINQPPIYTVTINPQTTLHYGSQATFTSSYTGTPSAYAWYLDSSTTPIGTASTLAITPTVSTYTYGGHLLMLVVTDINGFSYTGSVAITVQN